MNEDPYLLNLVRVSREVRIAKEKDDEAIRKLNQGGR